MLICSKLSPNQAMRPKGKKEYEQLHCFHFSVNLQYSIFISSLFWSFHIPCTKIVLLLNLDQLKLCGLFFFCILTFLLVISLMHYLYFFSIKMLVCFIFMHYLYSFTHLYSLVLICFIATLYRSQRLKKQVTTIFLNTKL